MCREDDEASVDAEGAYRNPPSVRAKPEKET